MRFDEKIYWHSLSIEVEKSLHYIILWTMQQWNIWSTHIMSKVKKNIHNIYISRNTQIFKINNNHISNYIYKKSINFKYVNSFYTWISNQMSKNDAKWAEIINIDLITTSTFSTKDDTSLSCTCRYILSKSHHII